ncbi:hypothetical protein HPB50_008503 [Hyalomma asiaticum]|uniref:Uncharacterized protein n=1 Tax=Hyalomma asiaticum TaxID=266040 RepID=A0ACB7TH38_HYAAI|nr:hypothetical protein HPB50_008503 [Hyalomma asiaticum]
MATAAAAVFCAAASRACHRSFKTTWSRDEHGRYRAPLLRTIYSSKLCEREPTLLSGTVQSAIACTSSRVSSSQQPPFSSHDVASHQQPGPWLRRTQAHPAAAHINSWTRGNKGLASLVSLRRNHRIPGTFVDCAEAGRDTDKEQAMHSH